MNNYGRGRVVEYKITEELRAAGYFAVRTAGSKGLFDIIGYKDNELRLIQAKRIKAKKAKKKKGWITPKLQEDENVKAFRSLKVPVGVTKELWVFADRIGWISKEVIHETQE